METVFKCILCFAAQLLALYAYWHCFFGHNEFFLHDNDNSTPRTSLTALHITCPSEKVAKALSYGLVEKRFAACVNIVPKVTSIYSWNGTIEEDSEVLMIVKTKHKFVPQIIQFVKKGHPYDTPEVISFGILDGNEDYLNWVARYVENAL